MDKSKNAFNLNFHFARPAVLLYDPVLSATSMWFGFD